MSPSLLAGIDAGHPISGPGTIHIDITNACNADCLPCWDHSPLLERPRPPEWKNRRMDPAVVEGLLDDAIRLGGLRMVILSGMGEPFVHPEIDRLIGIVKSRGLRLTLISNLMAERAANPRRLAAMGVDEILVSIHAATEETYRALHPNFGDGAWAELLGRLESLAAAGCACKHVHVICAPNAEELPGMIELGRRRGASEVSFKLAGLGGGTEACRIGEEQRRRLMEETVPAAAAMCGKLGVRSNLALFARQLAAAGAAGDAAAATVPVAEAGCFMGYAYARVTVEGTVLYCCNAGIVVGSLRPGSSFSDLWRSPEWDGVRARIRQGRYFQGCECCGKFAQNVKLGRQFEAAYGKVRYDAVTGRGVRGDGAPCP
jgi:MoaA/NifB/PqqE/SkfB family radical SAM enzyme